MKRSMVLLTIALAGAPIHAAGPCGNYPIDPAKEYCYRGYKPVALGIEMCESMGGPVEYDPRRFYCSNGVVVKAREKLCVSGTGLATSYDPQVQFCYKGQPALFGMKFCEYTGGRMHIFDPRKNETCNGTVQPAI